MRRQIFILTIVFFLLGCRGISPQRLQSLIRDLKSTDVITRLEAARALRDCSDKAAVEPLTAALKDENGFVRCAAAEALGRTGDKKAIQPLIEALGEEKLREGGTYWFNSGMRYSEGRLSWCAKEALVEIGEPAVGPLVKALKDENKAIRHFAQWALCQITGQDFGEDFDKWSKWYDENKDK